MNSMFKTLTILALIGFIAMAVFSFLGMGEHAGYHSRCLAELASNSVCPPNSGPVLASLFHVNAFKTFSTGLVNAVIFGLIALFALLISPPVHRPALPILVSRLNQTDSLPPADPYVTDWLARLQNSPSNTDNRFRLPRNG